MPKGIRDSISHHWLLRPRFGCLLVHLPLQRTLFPYGLQNSHGVRCKMELRGFLQEAKNYVASETYLKFVFELLEDSSTSSIRPNKRTEQSEHVVIVRQSPRVALAQQKSAADKKKDENQPEGKIQ